MELIAFPNLGQLNDQGEPNRAWDCVPTSLANALTYLTGKQFDGADIKDSVYGRPYVGGTAARAFIGYCAYYGVTLWSITGTTARLVEEIRAQIDQQHPVLITVPDVYIPQPNTASHVLCAYKTDERSIYARDPYSCVDVVKTDNELASMLQFNEIWPLAKKATGMNGIPSGWKDDGKKLQPIGCDFAVVLGFRDHILKDPTWNSNDWPLENEAGLPQVELSNQSLGKGTRQRFRLTTLEWTEKHGVFVGWSGQELIFLEAQLKKYVQLAVSSQSEIAQLNAQITQLKAAHSGSSTSPLPFPMSPETKQVIHDLIALFSATIQ